MALGFVPIGEFVIGESPIGAPFGTSSLQNTIPSYSYNGTAWVAF